jgi:hypothetical protein
VARIVRIHEGLSREKKAAERRATVEPFRSDVEVHPVPKRTVPIAVK